MTEPRRIGRYEVTGIAGRGGMATVYVASQTDLGRTVALKQLSAFQAENEVVVTRFLRESRLAAALSHPSIVIVHESFTHEGLPYIAMEYFRRGSLRPLVGRLDLPRVAAVLESVLAGLAHAEEQRIVHRDLKPENLLITDDGRVKISDFGVAKALGDTLGDGLRTATGSALGTPAYMSPEQALGQEVDGRTDLYAVGVIAFELLSGETPFSVRPGDTPLALLLKHVNEAPPALRGVEPAVAAWVARLLAKDPGDRPSGASAAWEELEEAVVGACGPKWRREALLPEIEDAVTEPLPADGVATEPPPPSEQSLPAIRARRAWALPGAGALLTVAAAVVLVIALAGGGSSRTGLRLSVPACIHRFLAGTVAQQTIIVGVTNRFPIAGSDGQPVGLVLGDARPVIALRYVHHPGSPEYFAIQGAAAGPRCASPAIHDVTSTGVLPNAAPYDDLRIDYPGRRVLFLRLGVASPGTMEADFRAG